MPRASILLMKVFNNKFFCLAIFVISILFICCMDSVRASGDNLIENGSSKGLDDHSRLQR
jgi:hypothetical protein